MKPHFKTIGEIKITNTLSATEDTPAYAVAVRLLESSFQGMPVLDRSGTIVGKVTEIDLLMALKEGKDLREIRVREIMVQAPPVVTTETPLAEAVGIMHINDLIRLPVTRDGRFIGSVTRHDLLRAWLGYWVMYERGGYAQVIG